MTDENTPGPYNPDDHNVDEVREYLKSATADEVGRVKAAEAEGQKRKGILEWAPDKGKTPKDGDGYDRVPVADPYPPGEPSAWGHGGLNEGEPGSDEPVEQPEAQEG